MKTILTINDFKKIIDTSGDITFDCLGASYTILTWTDKGIVIGKQNDDDDCYYESSDDLIANYKINGKYISDVIDKINVTFYS